MMVSLTSFTAPNEIGGRGGSDGKGTDSPTGQKEIGGGGKGTDSPTGQKEIGGGGKGTDSPVGQ